VTCWTHGHYRWSRKIDPHDLSKLPPEVIVKVVHVGWVYRNESDVVPAILSHLPAHGSYIVVPCSRVRRIYQSPVLDDKVVLRKEEVRLAYLVFEDEPIITHRLSLIIVSNAVTCQVIANDFLSFTSDLLTSQGD